MDALQKQAQHTTSVMASQRCEPCSMPPFIACRGARPAALLLQRNFGNPVEWALVKEYPWSTPQLRKVDQQQQ